MLVDVGDTLKRAYLPHRGVISLVVNLARGEHVQVAMIGRDSIFGVFSALGDPVALNSAVVLVPGPASTIDLDRLRAAADKSATLARGTDPARACGVRADPADGGLQRLAYRGIPAGAVPAADPRSLRRRQAAC